MSAAPGSAVFLSQEQYFRLFRDRLPAEQWQARGFLIDLEVTRDLPHAGGDAVVPRWD